MADTVRIRNISDQDLHIAVLHGRLVKADCVTEIPARLLNHQPACDGTTRAFDPDTGTWPEKPCEGCLAWPEETWKVETTSTSAKAKG